MNNGKIGEFQKNVHSTQNLCYWCKSAVKQFKFEAINQYPSWHKISYKFTIIFRTVVLIQINFNQLLKPVSGLLI